MFTKFLAHFKSLEYFAAEVRWIGPTLSIQFQWAVHSPLAPFVQRSPVVAACSILSMPCLHRALECTCIMAARALSLETRCSSRCSRHRSSDRIAATHRVTLLHHPSPPLVCFLS